MGGVIVLTVMDAEERPGEEAERLMLPGVIVDCTITLARPLKADL